MSILRLKVHYGTGMMSPELPKQEVKSWIAASALSHRHSVSSVSLVLSALHTVSLILLPSALLVKLHFPVSVEEEWLVLK